MPARVIVIGLDSSESTLIERWTSEGKLPALAELYEQGQTYDLDNCWSTLPTSVWPELTSGRAPGRLALFFPPNQLRTGEVELRPVSPDEVDPRGFWTIASDAGKRVAAIDLPWTVPPRDLNGIFLAEWGTHDRWFGTASFPPALAVSTRQRYGEYPVRLCDHDYGDSTAERLQLAAELVEAVDHETRLLLDLLGQGEWDLFACAYGQFQCVGHNFWGFMDTQTRVPDAIRNAIFDVYSKVDEGVGALRAAAGPEAVSVVVASHGMGPLAGGPQLLHEVLVRLGAGSGKGSAAKVRSRLPIGVRSTIRKLVPAPLRRPLQRAAGSLPAPLASSATKAVALPADIGGYVRLNLEGREPNGSVEPGAEAEAVLAELRRALLELEDPASGERIVVGVVSAEEAFGPDRHPDVPDLMVSFRHDLGPLDACMSDRVELVNVPHRIVNRSGDHTGEARLWLTGKGILRPEAVGRAHALDVAPTILSLLEVPIPSDLHGRYLVERDRSAPKDPA
ncbi:MAG: alkaline phosphatase family protein [Actinomycetota bacterium]|nr:alkaline phosphatase family protein [Actinomycetota bacterium]